MNNISAVNARINKTINNHKIASYIIAGSLLASVSFVSATAIATQGQIAKDSHEVPAVSVPGSNKSPEDKPADQPVETGHVESANTTSPSSPSLTLASTAPAAVTAAPSVVTPAPATLPPAQQPAAPAPVEPPVEEPVDETPDEETPVDPIPTPGFELAVTNIDALGMFYPDENDNWRFQAIGDMEVAFDEDYDLTGKAFTIETSTTVDGAECGIEPDKGWVYFSFPATTPAGQHTCEVTLSDGTVSSTAQLTINFTAPAWML